MCLEWMNHLILHLHLNPWLENMLRSQPDNPDERAFTLRTCLALDNSYMDHKMTANIAKGRQVLEAQVLEAQTLVAKVLVENETLQKGAKCLYRAVGSWR